MAYDMENCKKLILQYITEQTTSDKMQRGITSNELSEKLPMSYQQIIKTLKILIIEKQIIVTNFTIPTQNGRNLWRRCYNLPGTVEEKHIFKKHTDIAAADEYITDISKKIPTTQEMLEWIERTGAKPGSWVGFTLKQFKNYFDLKEWKARQLIDGLKVKGFVIITDETKQSEHERRYNVDKHQLTIKGVQMLKNTTLLRNETTNGAATFGEPWRLAAQRYAESQNEKQKKNDKKTEFVCFAKKCVWRMEYENGVAYCPFRTCMAKNVQYIRVEQPKKGV